MLETTQTLIADLVKEAARPLTRSPRDYDPLLDYIGEARFVLLGEASHGTHEFYRERALITKRLIAEKGFHAVAVEADWPDAWRINTYVRGRSQEADTIEAFAGFRRFPAWMWRNADVLDFVGWLRAHNDSHEADASKAGFYGLDLYSLHTSIAAVLTYLDKVDPAAAERARRRYACFEDFGADPQSYGYSAGFGLAPTCEEEVVSQLVELQRRAADYARRDGRIAEDNFFHAQQNASLVKDAEEYYRTMFRGRAASWNLRDEHMANTLDALVEHLSLRVNRPKVVIWAHNSHLGDASATQMGREGEWNVGELARQRHSGECVLIGFTTYTGTVTAASNWDAPAERMKVVPGRPGSYEELFHSAGIPAFLLMLPRGSAVANGLAEPMLERAIGVIYRPDTELASHYFKAELSNQFDAVIHFDETRAVEPLERTVEWDAEPAETFPFGV
ncbi:MAG: erythromycin esterase family protein [Acidobacteriota bacterium]|nr:erythromycin esterase family protein [Acidobacteriota bacterium]